jgi:hypothetical protein
LPNASQIDFGSIIAAASKGPLGLVALGLLAITGVAFSFFRKEASIKVRFWIFGVVTFVAVCVVCIPSLIEYGTEQRAIESRRVKAEVIKNGNTQPTTENRTPEEIPRSTVPIPKKKRVKVRLNSSPITTSSSSAPIQTEQSCPNGICIGGANFGSPTVNNYGPPIPKITWVQEQYTDPPYRMGIRLSVDHSMEIPAFVATCDRPCKSISAFAIPSGATMFMGMINPMIFRHKSDSRIAGIMLRSPRPLGVGMNVNWTIDSDDQMPVRVVEVRGLTGDEAAKMPMP